MRIRQLQYFLVVAEEQSFTRAAARVHIRQSPLSRAIKELEDELGVQLFVRDKGRIRLTWPGEVFRDDARRLLSFLNSVRARTKAAKYGFRGHLRIALTDGLAQPRMTELLAKCREEEPLTDVRVFEMTVGEMVQALKFDQIDAGFTVHAGYQIEILIKDQVWTDRLVFAVPTRHPLLARDKLSLEEAVQHPLIICHPERCEGGYDVIHRLFRNEGLEPVVAQYVSGHELMMMFVAAGYGIGLALESQVALYCHPSVIIRSIQKEIAEAPTFLIRSNRTASPELERFLLRAKKIGGTTK
ncbi:Transcriptional regulator, LysR family [Pseudomonas chlororaphis subsp. aureofaciens]|uniref:LysR family transcriptional regulator n=1 Tax=Pseudomonas chlororaphis TaxID=587753 RepID=UPI000F56788D|nr:LysR family transcriptional regulator [Pseudomonas chlororaphis]AZD86796.1 Transcriptional regulator, LysR family [Pseudomonas chlororaphis subsp. aureofaciens]